MIQIVDSYFTTEAAGNPDKLKCSLLEAYTERNGCIVKAYDFRRDAKVREHMEELKQMVLDENGMRFMQGESYKRLDVNKILKARRDPDELRLVLAEMDDYWKQVYENSLENTRRYNGFRKKIEHLGEEAKELTGQISLGQEQSALLRKENCELTVENRYLRKMLKTYLYPALANEILQQENLLKNADTEISPQAEKKLIDGKFPSGVKEAVSEDAKEIAREIELLEQMWEGMNEL